MSKAQKAKFKATMIKKFGSEEAWRRHMAEVGMKGRKTGTGGFYYMAKNDPERLKAVGRKGGKKGVKRLEHS